MLQRLGAHGYTVRGRIGETFWDASLIPQDIIALYSDRFLVTHFWVEAEIDGAWRSLDASFQPEMANHGFRTCDWDSNTTCFEITKLYTQQETIAYQAMWQNPTYGADYFKENGSFLKRLNTWLASLT